MKSEDFASWQESYDKPDSVLKSRHNFANKGLYSQDYGLPSGHIQLWKLDLKKGRTPKNWCLQTVVLEKTPKSLLVKEIESVNLKGDQPWIFTEAEAPVCWSSANSWFIRKVPDDEKNWGQKKKRASEDEMGVWHHWCNEHEFGQTPEDGEDQGGLACCSPWGRKLSDVTGWLTNNNNSYLVYMHNIFFIQTSTDEAIGCFQALSFINSAAVNIGVNASFWKMIFSEYTPRSGIITS